MKSTSLQELINKIDDLHEAHVSTRGILQFVNKGQLGKSKLAWRSAVKSRGFSVSFSFDNAISEEDRLELNSLSDYMNQNFIVRLHSLLEYEGIKSKGISIDKSLSGHEMIEIIHFLRKQFAHRHGKFDPNDSSSVQLRKRLFDTFGIPENESLPDQFPLDKKRVIEPIVEGVKLYVNDFWKKNHERS